MEQGKSIYSNLRDSGRVVAAGLVSEVFFSLSAPPQRRNPRALFGIIAGVETLTRTAPTIIGGSLHEIGLLAGTTHPEYGNVSVALRLAAGELHQHYLKADDPQNYRRCQDGAHLLLHLANNCLPAQAAGSRPQDIAPLRQSFKELQADADYEHVIKLSGVALHALTWREQNHALATLAPEPLSLSAEMKKHLSEVEPFYVMIGKQAARFIADLAIQKAAAPGL